VGRAGTARTRLPTGNRMGHPKSQDRQPQNLWEKTRQTSYSLNHSIQPRMDGARGSASLESLRGTPAIGQAGDEQGQLVRRQRPQSGGNLLLSKFFCCFRTIDANGQRQRCAIGDNNQQQYAIGGGGQCHQVEQQPTKLYSW